MHKVITFGIPSYNAAKDMDHCITSILEGSNYATDIEIIVVDDGSKDETAAKADEWRPAIPALSARCTRKTAATVSPSSRACVRRTVRTTRSLTRMTGSMARRFRPCCRFYVALRSATSASTCLSRIMCTRRSTRAHIPLLATSLPCRAKRSLPGIKSVISVWTRIWLMAQPVLSHGVLREF